MAAVKSLIQLATSSDPLYPKIVNLVLHRFATHLEIKDKQDRESSWTDMLINEIPDSINIIPRFFNSTTTSKMSESGLLH